MNKNGLADEHPFVKSPHRTLIGLSLPVLVSLIAEPLTGLIDTGFVAQLGTVPLAALGVGTTALTSVFWVFNFLGIGSQTEVAKALGRNNFKRAQRVTSLSLVLAAGLGLLFAILAFPFLSNVATALGAADAVQADAVTYMRYRLFGGPAVLISMVAFGSLRGMQDMRTPSFIAVGVNVLNIVLDWIMIFGVGAFPELGVAGAALASAISQWVGALFALWMIGRKLGFVFDLKFSEAREILVVGGDLFVRTGMLMLFLIVATRVANQAGPQSGAAHQAIRQIWIFAALLLEAFATTAQTLVGYFFGAQDRFQAKRVALVSMWWSLGTGVVMLFLMWLGERGISNLLVPADAMVAFSTAWIIAAAMQPINSLAFITDGIHWGTGDYRYLKIGMVVSSLVAGGTLFLIDTERPDALMWVWLTTALWVSIRAVFGMLRVWPAVGDSPFKLSAT